MARLRGVWGRGLAGSYQPLLRTKRCISWVSCLISMPGKLQTLHYTVMRRKAELPVRLLIGSWRAEPTTPIPKEPVRLTSDPDSLKYVSIL